MGLKFNQGAHMNKRGVTTAEIFMWMIGGVMAIAAYAHMTFATYREVVPRLDRIETLILEMKK